MQTILLSVGTQSLLIALCIHFSYGSWTELQQSLIVIGCTVLFIWSSLYMFGSPELGSHPSINNTTSNDTNSKCNNDQIGEIKDENADCNEYTNNARPQTPKSPQRMVPSPVKSLKNKVLLASSSTSITSSSVSTIVDSMGDINNNKNSMIIKKRSDYLEWTEYFLSVAMLSAMRSKDPSTQVGACIVNEDKRIVGIGYNGFPVGCSDDILPWNRKSKNGINDTKYPYVCHAEMNAILNKNSATLKNCTIYVGLFPCNECAKIIIQSGIKKIVYISDKYSKQDIWIASKKLLTMAGVTYQQYIPNKKSILINFPIQ